MKQAVDLAKAGDEEQAQQLRKTKWVETANYLRDQTDHLAQINREAADQAAQRAEKGVGAAINGGIVALVSGTALALLLSFLLAHHLELRLLGIVHAARDIAQGNVRTILPKPSQDEVGRLITSVAEM